MTIFGHPWALGWGSLLDAFRASAPRTEGPSFLHTLQDLRLRERECPSEGTPTLPGAGRGPEQPSRWAVRTGWGRSWTGGRPWWGRLPTGRAVLHELTGAPSGRA